MFSIPGTKIQRTVIEKLHYLIVINSAGNELLIKLIAEATENEVPFFHSHHFRKEALAEGIFNMGKRFCTVKKEFFH